jgi:two-component system response regulator NreC
VKKIRVVVVDDHALLRTGLAMLLNSQSDIEVVGEAGDLASAVAVTRRVRPDVVLLDLSLPGSKGAEAVESFLSDRNGARVLVLTMHDDPAYMQAALAAGALGYVVKKAADSELTSAVRAVASGRTFLDVTLQGKVPRLLADARRRAIHGKTSALSAREHQVLQLLALGQTNREVAQHIGIGVKTVETYRLRLGTKLGLRTRADIVTYALENGLLRPESQR